MPDQDELIRTVADDLRYLQTEWDQTIDDNSLRRASPTLRRLIVDQEYTEAWKAVGLPKSPLVDAPDLLGFLGLEDRSHITFASAGGAQINGVLVAALILRKNYAFSSAEVAARFKKGPFATPIPYYLHQFRESACVLVDGVAISRREVIQYIANKCGGAHFDESRKAAKDAAFALLDKVTDAQSAERVEVLGKPAVYFELLSIGQSLAHARDTQTFLSRVP